MKMYSDYHVHTNYSDDSTYLMEDVIKDAIKMKFGLERKKKKMEKR